ncbi:protein-L-isoaspartate(D-aspartate) O-methyltransferase [Acidobacteriota bacterium]
MKKGIFFLVVFLYAAFFSPGAFTYEQNTDVYAQLRIRMVERQLAARDITDPSVLKVMGEVPRHLFVSPSDRNLAYNDYALPIDEGQTISQPYIVALMTQHLNIKKGDKVLEVGTGSGYQAAVLAHLADQVYSVEIREDLANRSIKLLKDLSYDNVYVKVGDGYMGWEEHAPYDAIIVTCAANRIPPLLLEQLKEGGRLVIPIERTSYYQILTRVTKKNGKPVVERLTDVRFVPMVGEIKKKKK